MKVQDQFVRARRAPGGASGEARNPAAGSGRIGGMLRRFQSLSWALTDQALFAGSNFVLGVLTARWLDETTFGALATALVVQTIVISMYEAAFNEPMTVLGAGRFRERFRPYLGALLVGHAAVAVAVSLCIGLAAVVFKLAGNDLLFSALAGLAISTPFVLARYLTRKACYTVFRPRSATLSGGLYAAVLMAGLGLFGSGISLAEVFLVLGVASTVAALATFAVLRPSRPDRDILRATPREHWSFARWTLGTAGLKMIPDHMWYLVLPLWFGWEANASLRALTMVNLVLSHTTSAVQMILLPALVRARTGSSRRFDRMSVGAALGLASACLLFWVALVLFGEEILDLLYAGKYVEHAGALAILGFVPAAWSIGAICAVRAVAGERPDLVFRGVRGGLVFTVPGLLLTYVYGLTGAAIGMVLVSALQSVLLLTSTWGPPSRWSGASNPGAAERVESAEH